MNNHGGKNILAKGQGIGRNSASGRVVIAKNAALIAEEGGLTSHAAIVGLNLGIPVLVGMTNATILLKDGQKVTVDAGKGMIYKGSTG
jgi:pyruvate kinase